MAYHPRGEGVKAAQREEAEARLQGWHASQATEAATQTTASQPFSHERLIPRQQDGCTEATNCD